jgi:hypothetical protein
VDHENEKLLSNYRFFLANNETKVSFADGRKKLYI